MPTWYLYGHACAPVATGSSASVSTYIMDDLLGALHAHPASQPGKEARQLYEEFFSHTRACRLAYVQGLATAAQSRLKDSTTGMHGRVSLPTAYTRSDLFFSLCFAAMPPWNKMQRGRKKILQAATRPHDSCQRWNGSESCLPARARWRPGPSCAHRR